MRAHVVLSLLVAASLSGCRTTRDADEGEVTEIGSVGGGLDTNRGIASDMGLSVLGATAALYSPVMSLSEKPEPGAVGAASGAIRDDGPAAFGTPREFGDAVRWVSQERAEWPDCVVEDEDGTGATYDDCSLSASASSASFEFGVSGFTDWTDNSSDAELNFDLAIGASGVSLDWIVDWTHGFEWTDTKLDGDFTLDYAYGLSLGGVPTAASVEFHAEATVEELTWDETCDGVVSGIFDWRSRLREGTDPWETSHVTIEVTACGEATITQ